MRSFPGSFAESLHYSWRRPPVIRVCGALAARNLPRDKVGLVLPDQRLTRRVAGGATLHPARLTANSAALCSRSWRDVRAEGRTLGWSTALSQPLRSASRGPSTHQTTVSKSLLIFLISFVRSGACSLPSPHRRSAHIRRAYLTWSRSIPLASGDNSAEGADEREVPNADVRRRLRLVAGYYIGWDACLDCGCGISW
jgi:hypothetical protein